MWSGSNPTSATNLKRGEKTAKKDLVPLNKRTKEEQKEIAKKGGIKSGEARRRKKTMRETMELMLSAKIPVENVPDELAKIGITDEDMTAQTAIIYSQVYKAIKERDTRAAEFCRDTLGEEKEERENKPVIFIPAKDIGKAFVDLNRWIDERKYREYWLEGGRGSVKSSYWSEKTIELLENNENMCAIIIRKVGNTLKDSVYSQVQWGIDQLDDTYPGIKDRWKGTTSPLQFVNKETGQIIYFRGADDPAKIKSIKPPKDKYIGVIVYEEFDQMNGMNEVRKIDQSVVRGGDDFVIFRVYNTPPSSRHFVNIEKKISKVTRIVHRSSYLDVPVEWLGKPFIDEAEYMKEVASKIYDNEYLGEETGDGGDVFENLEIREITDVEIDNFDYLYQGIDFGWYPDPLAWTKMCFQSNTRTLYIFDEFVINKMSNANVWKHLQEDKKVTSNDLITADSAEPKSIGDFQSYGCLMRGAKKEPDSVEYSMKWLSGLAKIVIDPVRCPRCVAEFTTYQYDQDKDGNYISAYVDKDNHCIDSVRYALNPIWRRKGE